MAGCNQPFSPSGPTRVDSLHPNGPRPPKRLDVLDINDCCAGGGGGGGNAIIIQNQGVTITNQASTINFEGSGVEAEITAPGVVTVFVPPPAFVSHFNTMDGTDDATVANATTASRHVSAPTAEGNPFKLGSFTAGSLQPTLKDTQLFFAPASLFSLFNTATTLTASVLDSDGLTILATNSQVISGNLDVTAQNIEIAVTNFAADSTKFKANVTITFNVGTILPTGGHFSLSIIHNDASDGLYTFAQNDIFRDPNNVPAIIFNSPAGTGVTIAENTPVIKRLSGAYWYDFGSTFSLAIPRIDELNNISYPTVQVVADGSEYGLPTLNLAGGSLTGWTDAFNNTLASYSLAAWAISVHDFFDLTTTAHVSGTPQDWGAQTTVNSNNAAVAIDTFNTPVASNTTEDFINESSRIESDLVTSWDSTQSLAVIDGGTGLQIYDSRLNYPTVNFTLYHPSPGSQPDYSALTGSRFYYRIFRDLTGGGTSHSNGLLLLGDFNITEANLTADDVRFEISLDGVNWYNMNLAYLGGPLNNGDGCRINSDQHFLPALSSPDNSIQFTLGAGGFTDVTTGGASGFGIFMRITYKSTVAGKAAYLGSLNITDW